MSARGLCGLVALVGLAVGCSGGEDGVEPVASTSCGQLLYEGEGDPDVIVVSDLPLRGIGGETTRLMVDTIEFVIRERDFRAGEHRVGYQSCNDTVGEEPFDPGLCRLNAEAYVEAAHVVGIIGPWNSGCAYEQIPILSRTEAGPLAMVSPAATNPELTRPVTGQPSGNVLYEDGVRNFARVVTHEHAQGIAAAYLAARSGAKRAAVLQQDLRDTYVRGLALPFLRAARELGLQTTRLEWEHRGSYVALARSVARSRPDVVYLAGLTQVNALRLVRDLRAALPARVRLLAPDGFAFGDVIGALRATGDGLLVTVPGTPVDELPPAGQAFLRRFGRAPVVELGQLGAPEAAQATEVLLDAIARSDGGRASVVEELFRTKIENGILGSFSFDRFGDVVPATIGVYRAEGGKLVVHGVVRVPLDALSG
jgi:branched-chain amino acid transport system substrate-binding protein